MRHPKLTPPSRMFSEVDTHVGLAGVVHDDRAVEALGDRTDAAVDLAQLALAVEEASVLRTIAVVLPFHDAKVPDLTV